MKNHHISASSFFRRRRDDLTSTHHRRFILAHQNIIMRWDLDLYCVLVLEVLLCLTLNVYFIYDIFESGRSSSSTFDVDVGSTDR